METLKAPDKKRPKKPDCREGINAELLKIVYAPPPWVKKLRNPDNSKTYFLTDHLATIAPFLNASTDSVRLVRASRASRKILAVDQLDDLEDLRSSLQVSELLRVIPYAKQTDHSAHTLYLYLLGIYLFFSCKGIRLGIAAYLGEKPYSEKLVSRFLFQWVFVSLLHDIGYVFQGRSKSEIRAVDRMFRGSTVTRYMDSDSLDLKLRVQEIIKGKEDEIKLFESIQNPEDMLSALRFMPWGKEADFSKDIFESFSVAKQDALKTLQIPPDKLEEYAYRVAASGYDGISEGTVDHAVASGLFLFRYSTFWYWLAKETRYQEGFSVYKSGGYPKDDVLDACYATAAHSVLGAHADGLDPLVFETSPLMYLGILCDELQKWDRFPAGTEYLANLEAFEQYCTDSERIIVDGKWDGDKVTFNFTEKRLGDNVNKSLIKRKLADLDKYIEVNPEPKPPRVEPETPAAEPKSPKA